MSYCQGKVELVSSAYSCVFVSMLEYLLVLKYF